MSTNSKAIIARRVFWEARRQRIRLLPDGETLIVLDPVSDHFRRNLVRFKPELLRLLIGNRVLARHVLAGEFEPLTDGWHRLLYDQLVGQIYDELCFDAFEHLRVAAKQQLPNFAA